MTTQNDYFMAAALSGGGHGVTALPSSRHGLTLTEILASVFVLSFGLVAAMTVLPFASFMLGRMDVADTGGACGRGALHQIRMAEWQKPEIIGWLDLDSAPADPYIVDPLGLITLPVPLPPAPPDDPGSVVADKPFPAPGTGLFAFNLAEITDQPTVMESFAVANQHFRWGDDTVFADDGASRPQLVVRGDGKPSATGDYTWLYMVTPLIDPQAVITPRTASMIATIDPYAVLGYEVAVAVFHRRDTAPDPADPYQPIRRVNIANTDSTINETGAYIVLTSDNPDPDVLALSTINWLLLATEPSVVDEPFNAQWYRITGYDDIMPNADGGYSRRVFLVGPDWKGAKDANAHPLGTVYAILCDGVVNVFQATMPK